MRRMLDPKTIGGGGGLPPTIEFDKDGNRNVTKDLGVDGKLKLKSLVSASNPDGDITKELGGGGGTLYWHHISLNLSNTTIGGYLVLDYYSKKPNKVNRNKEFISAFNGKYLICSGYVIYNNQRCLPLHIYSTADSLYVRYVNSSNVLNSEKINDWNFNDYVYEVN